MNKIAEFISQQYLFPEMFEFGVAAEDNDLLYAELYLLKKMKDEYNLDFDKIKQSSSIEEYEKNLQCELSKITDINSDFEMLFWNRIYENRESVFTFIESLDVSEFNIEQKGDAWLCDDYLSQFIDYNNTKDVLSVFITFYDSKLSEETTVDVIYNEFLSQNMAGHKARLDMVGNHNYHFTLDKYPRKFDKDYDLVVMELDYYSVDSLDKSGLIKMVDGVGGVFAGNDILNIIADIEPALTENGMAIIKMPFTFISKLDNSLIDQNFIDKIIYLPMEKTTFADENCLVKNVYLILKKNKDNDEIMFIDEASGEQCSVPNDLIKKHNGCTNMHIYNKHDPLLEQIYRLKNDNAKQIDIIASESIMIDKSIDEMDFD